MADAVRPAYDYDEMVDWNKRLARELPFFLKRFAEAGVTSVLDVGCGSGKHAIALTREGFDVVGVDPADDMLAQARANARKERVAVDFVKGSFEDLPALVASGAVPSRVDAAISLGNVLPHVGGATGLYAALRDIAAIVRTDGIVIFHLLNHARLVNGRIRTLPVATRETPEGTKVFLKLMDYVDDGILFDFVTLVRRPIPVAGDGTAAASDSDPSEDWTLRSRRSVHSVITADTLRDALAASGFDRIEALGDHSGRQLDPDADESVIVVARRA